MTATPDREQLAALRDQIARAGGSVDAAYSGLCVAGALFAAWLGLSQFSIRLARLDPWGWGFGAALCAVAVALEVALRVASRRFLRRLQPLAPADRAAVLRPLCDSSAAPTRGIARRLLRALDLKASAPQPRAPWVDRRSQ